MTTIGNSDTYDNNEKQNTNENHRMIPVDRWWIHKLLKKHCPYPLTTDTSTLDNNDNDNNDDNNNDSNKQQNQPPEQEQEQQQEEEEVPPKKKLMAYVLAPMVDQSDLPFRLLCRKYGCNLCYTPMIHSKLYATSKAYRTKFHINTHCNQDRPLIAQLCGGGGGIEGIHYVVQTALLLAPYVDGIDINCGCPQNIAKRGMYGAFLLEQPTMLLQLIKELVKVVPVPISVKVRLVPANASVPPSSSTTTTTTQPTPPANEESLSSTKRQKHQEQDDENDVDEEGEGYCNCYDNEEDDNVHKNNTNQNEQQQPQQQQQEEKKDEDELLHRTLNNNPTCNNQQQNSNSNNNNNKKNTIESDRDASIRNSIELYGQLIDAGIHLLTIHGRTRHNKGPAIGPCDWDAISQIVQLFGHRIPIFVNGSIMTQQDIHHCLQQIPTIDGIMSSESILEYPPLFHGLYEYDCTGTIEQSIRISNHKNRCSRHHPEDMNPTTVPSRSIGSSNDVVQQKPPIVLMDTATKQSEPKDDPVATTVPDDDKSIEPIMVSRHNPSNASDGEYYYYGPKELYIGRIRLCYEYLQLSQLYPPDVGGQGGIGIKSIRIHIHRLLHCDLQHPVYGSYLRQSVIAATSREQLYNAIQQVERIHQQYKIDSNYDIPNRYETWYMRHRVPVVTVVGTKDDEDTTTNPMMNRSFQQQHQQQALWTTSSCTSIHNNNNNNNNGEEQSTKGTKEGSDDNGSTIVRTTTPTTTTTTKTMAEMRSEKEAYVPSSFELTDDTADCLDGLFGFSTTKNKTKNKNRP